MDINEKERVLVMKKDIYRRDFLKGSLGSIAGVSLGTTVLGTFPRKVLGANNKVVLALIGCGSRGSGITKAMAQNENAG